MPFGTYLKQLRKKRGLSIRQLSAFSGVSHSYLSQIESGKRGVPKPEILQKLAPILHISYEKIMKEAGYLPNNINYQTQSAHRADDPTEELPEEARKSLEEFKEYILKKYGKKK